jgi:hypothetical protein
MHDLAFAHDTAWKYVPVLPLGTGAFISDHLLPFQRAMSGCVGEVAPGRLVPTAMQLFGVAHETPTRALAIACAFAGLGTTVQPRPFHRSMSGRVVPCIVTRLPTAKQVAVLFDDGLPVAHETASR